MFIFQSFGQASGQTKGTPKDEATPIPHERFLSNIRLTDKPQKANKLILERLGAEADQQISIGGTNLTKLVLEKDEGVPDVQAARKQSLASLYSDARNWPLVQTINADLNEFSAEILPGHKVPELRYDCYMRARKVLHQSMEYTVLYMDGNAKAEHALALRVADAAYRQGTKAGTTANHIIDQTEEDVQSLLSGRKQRIFAAKEAVRYLDIEPYVKAGQIEWRAATDAEVAQIAQHLELSKKEAAAWKGHLRVSTEELEPLALPGSARQNTLSTMTTPLEEKTPGRPPTIRMNPAPVMPPPKQMRYDTTHQKISAPVMPPPKQMRYDTLRSINPAPVMPKPVVADTSRSKVKVKTPVQADSVLPKPKVKTITLTPP